MIAYYSEDNRDRIDNLNNFGALFVHNQLDSLWQAVDFLRRQVEKLEAENTELRKAISPVIALPEDCIMTVAEREFVAAWSLGLAEADFDYNWRADTNVYPFDFVVAEVIL